MHCTMNKLCESVMLTRTHENDTTGENNIQSTFDLSALRIAGSGSHICLLLCLESGGLCDAEARL